ncbi:MAG: ATP-binding cassette domain-containing protein [Hyphomicrobiaceae bacterium]
MTVTHADDAHHDHHGHDHGHTHHHHAHAGTLPGRTDVLLAARGLRFARAGRAILEDIDLDLAPREIVTLIGPNGAGKTTLVRVLLGLERPDGGTITRRPSLRVGYAPQRFDRDPVIPMTVARFLAIGSRHTPAEASAALAEVGAARVIGQQLSQLSGGELQRVVLARALLRKPDLLVLDEPVRGVDYAGEAELYDLIGRIRDVRGVGVLLVSHDLHVVMAQSDRVICINRHICCSGVPDAVAQHPEYARLFGAEAARSFALYHHQHDHSHDLSGKAMPVKDGEDSANGGA